MKFYSTLLCALCGVCSVTLAAEVSVTPSVVAPATAATTGTSRRAPGTLIVPTLEKPASAGPRSEQDMAGYLMVYFKDETHCAYFAISRDGRVRMESRKRMHCIRFVPTTAR